LAWPNWLSLPVAMLALRATTRRSKAETERVSPQRALSDYLDGYFNSFDFYPVCERHLFVRNDAFALWTDFMRIYDDLSQSTADLINHTERFVDADLLGTDELKAYQREAAKRALQRLIENSTE
jgi:hypothetical protein